MRVRLPLATTFQTRFTPILLLVEREGRLGFPERLRGLVDGRPPTPEGRSNLSEAPIVPRFALEWPLSSDHTTVTPKKKMPIKSFVKTDCARTLRSTRRS